MSVILGEISKSHHAFESVRKNCSGRSQLCALTNNTSCDPKGLGIVIPLHPPLAAARPELWHCFSMCATESVQDTSPSTSSPPATEPGSSSGMAVTLWRWFLILDSLDVPWSLMAGTSFHRHRYVSASFDRCKRGCAECCLPMPANSSPASSLHFSLHLPGRGKSLFFTARPHNALCFPAHS